MNADAQKVRSVFLAAVEKHAPDQWAAYLDEALCRLAAEDPTKAELVKLRFFGGLSVEDAGRVLGIARATADRYWSYARVWLYSALSEAGARPGVAKKSPEP